MKKKYSLKKQHYFNKVINKGQKIKSQFFLISFLKSKEFKIEISVPKKLGNAVFRNYNKRVIKNIIPNLDIYDKKVHIVLIVKKNFIVLNIEEKKNILLKELGKINEK